MLDLIIIGAGVAGLTAAIYSARAGLNFAVLEQDGFGGGQISSAHTVDNYPGFKGTSGDELANAIREHAEALGANIEFAVVKDIVKENDAITVVSDDDLKLQAKSVIIATGSAPKKLGVSGEDALVGCGVSYCALCDGAFYKDKNVVVVGGGDTAVEDAIYLSDICKSVTLIHRRDTFRAPETRVAALKSKSNVDIIYNETVKEIIGDDKVSGVLLSDDSELPCDGVFIAVGSEPELSFTKSLDLAFSGKYIVATEDCKTNSDGIFVAGDVRTKLLRQVVTAAADGANAANSVIKYLSCK